MTGRQSSVIRADNTNDTSTNKPYFVIRADKEKLGEISKEDWFDTLAAAGLNVNM